MARGLLMYILNAQKSSYSSICYMIPPTHGMIAAKTYNHDGEKAHEGLGIGHWDVTDCSLGEIPKWLTEQMGTRNFEYTQNFGCCCSGYNKWRATGRIQHLCQYHNKSLSQDSDAREYWTSSAGTLWITLAFTGMPSPCASARSH